MSKTLQFSVYSSHCGYCVIRMHLMLFVVSQVESYAFCSCINLNICPQIDCIQCTCAIICMVVVVALFVNFG